MDGPAGQRHTPGTGRARRAAALLPDGVVCVRAARLYLDASRLTRRWDPPGLGGHFFVPSGRARAGYHGCGDRSVAHGARRQGRPRGYGRLLYRTQQGIGWAAELLDGLHVPARHACTGRPRKVVGECVSHWLGRSKHHRSCRGFTTRSSCGQALSLLTSGSWHINRMCCGPSISYTSRSGPMAHSLRSSSTLHISGYRSWTVADFELGRMPFRVSGTD